MEQTNKNKLMAELIRIGEETHEFDYSPRGTSKMLPTAIRLS
jgi:hypothetical protein